MRAAVTLLLVLLVGLLAVGLRVRVSAARLLSQADTATGDERRLLLGQAARLRGPFSPAAARALELLVEEARAAEGRVARAEWEEVRASLLGARSLVQPEPALLAEATRALEALERDAASRDGRTARVLPLTPPAPDPGWTLLLLSGLVVWVASAYRLLGRSASDPGTGASSPRLLVALAVGLVAFWLGLWRA